MPKVQQNQNKRPQKKARRDLSTKDPSTRVAMANTRELRDRKPVLPESVDPNGALPEGYEVDAMGITGSQLVKTVRIVGELAEESPDLIEGPDSNVRIQAVPKENIAGAYATTTYSSQGEFVINVAQDAFAAPTSLLKTTLGHEIYHAKRMSEGLGRQHPADIARHELEAHQWEAQNQDLTGDNGGSAYRSKRHYARRYREAKRNHPGAVSGLEPPRRPY